MTNNRYKKIIRTSVVGIIVNIVLVVFKMIVGLLANSISIVLDAVNNLSDVLSSVITIAGTKLSSKAPDKEHPYGHGRIEYLTAVAISLIALLAGAVSLKESVIKIFYPEETNYSAASLIIVAAAVAAKLFIGKYVKSVGVKLNSQSLIASGTDAFSDAVLSFGTLVTALVGMIWSVNLEGIMGAVISVFILKAGLEILTDTLNSIIGVRFDSKITESLKDKINSFDEVKGTYDLALHSYGPTNIIGTAHIEVDDNMTAREIHKLSRKISAQVLFEFGIILTIGIYASNDSAEFKELKSTVENVVAKYPEILQMHGFYAEDNVKYAMFDLVVDFDSDSEEIRENVMKDLNKVCPEYIFDIIMDSDYSD